jgi:hypothetical protein
MVDPIVCLRVLLLSRSRRSSEAFNSADFKHPIAMVGELPSGALTIQIDLKRRIRTTLIA